MSYEFYKVLHIFSVAILLVAMGGLAVIGRGDDPTQRGTRKLLVALHGVALLLILAAGFGAMLRLGISHGGPWPGWIYAKFGVWLLFGAALVLPKRMPQLAKVWVLLFAALAGVAAYLAVIKPF